MKEETLGIQSDLFAQVADSNALTNPITTIVSNGKQNEAAKLLYEIFCRAASNQTNPYCNITMDRFGPRYALEWRKISRELRSKFSLYKVHYILDIQSDNLEFVKELSSESDIFDVRHLDGLKLNFGITGQDYYAHVGSFVKGIPEEMVWSQNPTLLDQMNDLYSRLWENAIPVEQRFRELEEGTARYRSLVIQDSHEILEETKRMLGSSEKRYCISSEASELQFAEENLLPEIEETLRKFRAGTHEGIQWVTSIDKSSTRVAKKLVDLGVAIRHLARSPVESFGISEKEMGVSVSRMEAGSRLNISTLFSNDPMYLDHYSSLFRELWESGVDARVRLKEIEEGLVEPSMRIIRNHTEVKTVYLDLVNRAKEEILLIVPTANSYLRQIKIGVIDALRAAAEIREVKVQILIPDVFAAKRRAEEWGIRGETTLRAPNIDQRTVSEAATPNAITLLVVDRTSSLIIEQKDDSKREFEDSIGVATYSVHGSAVKANVRFFERMLEEETLLEKERKSRREAELLQDILAHDIRNFNQVIKLGAEILREELGEDQRLIPVLNNMEKAIDDSSLLLERAKRLGRVLSDQNPQLYAVDVLDALEKSISVVRSAYADKTVKHTVVLDPPLDTQRPIEVLADSLISEVFANIYSNSVKYTETPEVKIETFIEIVALPLKQQDDGLPHSEYIKVSIVDEGRGIADESKRKIFDRYLTSAKGSGLGMSIVHALVVERYRGRVEVKNRIEEDYAKGTDIEVYLQRAASAQTSNYLGQI